MTLALPRPAIGRFWTDTPGFATMAVVLTLAALPLLLAMQIDARQFQGESVWLKPLKFHLALVVYLATLAFYARFLPDGLTARRGWRIYETIVCIAIVLELLWIGGAAAMGTASHFNRSTPVWAAIYPMMGVAAVLLTSPTLVMGVAIWRQGGDALRLSLALGLVLTFGLTVIVAGALAQQPGHLVGTPVSGARLPLMGWSREVGDLRAAHFLATHAMHVLPLVGLGVLMLPQVWQKPLVWLAALGFALLVGASFLRALAGLPPI